MTDIELPNLPRPSGWAPTLKGDIYVADKVREYATAAILADREKRAQAAQIERIKELEERKDAAYLERNQVVAALASAYPSGIARTAIDGWSEDWHGCVYIDLPTGQASWHYHDSQAYLFAHLPAYRGSWDGHTTDEKYVRLAALATQQEAQPQAERGDPAEPMDDSDRLKPCPFCGSEAEGCTIPSDHPDAGAMFVQCTNSRCMASSALIYPLMDDPKPLLLERWNRRAPPPAPQSTEAELRARIAELEAQVSDRDEAELHMTLRIVRLEAVCREAEGALKEADNLVTLTSVESALASLRREIGGGNADQA